MQSQAIEITRVVKRFEGAAGDVRALDGIDMSIPIGQFVAVLGPSGCGKSTLLNLIAGFEAPSDGKVEVFGKPVRRPGPERAVVFQEAALFPWLNVFENVVFGSKIAGKKAADYADDAREFIRVMGLNGFETAMPGQLSGGMMQRVGIARALLMRPDVLLMDEPFGALDAQTRLMMQELLLAVWEKYRKTIFFITHDIDEAVLLADVVYVMSARPGRLKASLPIDLPRPRDVGLLHEQQFIALRREIFGLIRSESVGAH